MEVYNNSLRMLLKSIFHQKTTTEKQVSSQLKEVDSSSKFIWKIENFSKLKPEGHCSDVFTIAGRTWKVVLSPEKEVHDDNYSAMLKLVDGRPSTDLSVEFSIVITSQTDKKNTILKECTGQLLHLTELCNPDKGYIVNDTCIVEVRVSCSMKQVDDSIQYDGDSDGLESCLLKQEATNCAVSPYILVKRDEGINVEKENEEPKLETHCDMHESKSSSKEGSASCSKGNNTIPCRGSARSSSRPPIDSSTGPVTEEEIRAILVQGALVTPRDLVLKFCARLKSKENQDALAAMLRRISKIQKYNGANYVVLRDM